MEMCSKHICEAFLIFLSSLYLDIRNGPLKFCKILNFNIKRQHVTCALEFTVLRVSDAIIIF